MHFFETLVCMLFLYIIIVTIKVLFITHPVESIIGLVLGIIFVRKFLKDAGFW